MVALLGSLVLLAFFTVGSAFREASDEEFPFQVFIQTIEKQHLCGGAIITPKWILTTSVGLNNQVTVQVCYGSAKSSNPQACVKSQRIIHQNNFNLKRKKKLALIELESPIKFSKTTKQATLPRQTAQPRNTTKLSGWKVTVSQSSDVPPTLFVSDSYLVITEKCRDITGFPVILDIDEFCGMDKEFQNLLYNPGSIVSKSAIVLGILSETPLSGSQPLVYVKLSEHGRWVEEVLQLDAQHINWADEVPKDSAPSNYMTSLALLGISFVLLRFI